MLIANEVMYDEQKNLLLETFTNSASSEDPKTEADAVVDLVIKLVCLHRDLDPNDLNVRKSLEPEIRQKMHSFDPNYPELTHSAKLLRLLGGSNPGEMLSYAEDLVRARLTEERQRQASRARTTRKQDALEELIAGWLKLEPSLSTAVMVDRIRALRAIGIIEDVDEETIWYVPFPIDHPEKVKEIKISGMAARISRIKNRSR